MKYINIRNRRRYLKIIIAAVVCIFLFYCYKKMEQNSNRSLVPILLYHDITETGKGESSISEHIFITHLDAIKEAGYQTVTFQQLIDFVENGVDLPSKPILITFDDGYVSNYEIAYPALKERDMQATIFIIGNSVGKDTYKETGSPMIPHFSYEQAQEMVKSGTISIQSHTYDLHQYEPLEGNKYREGILPRSGETMEEYQDAIYQDLKKSISDIQLNLGETVNVLAYPFGLHTKESEEICTELGIKVTLTTQMEPAHLIQGDMNSLRLLGRYSIDDCTVDELFTLIEGK